MTKTPRISAEQLRQARETARDELAMLDGMPPHNVPWNICYGDGYFASSLLRKYKVSSIAALRKWANG